MTTPNRQVRCQGGFTLIELLAVVVLFAVIATFVSSNVLGVASDAARSGASASRQAEPAVYELTLAGQLVSLAGLALLLFGAGFWYLVELHRPGHLDRFRLGHFLLLALTYCLFFAVVAVLDSNGVGPVLAVGIAAAVSFPLLVLHVATIVGPRFAVTSALPLALLTTGTVVNGVYGGDLRSYVYLGIACVVIGQLTVTYPRLQRGQELRRDALEQQLTGAVATLATEAAQAHGAIADARATLALQDPGEHATLREWIEHRLDTLRQQLDSHEHLVNEHDAMRSTTARIERRGHRTTGSQLGDQLLSQLPQSRAALDEAVRALGERRRSRHHQAVDASTTEHCVACGHACAKGARYCPGCGTACASTVICRRCDQVLRLPLHLLRDDIGDQAPATHCLGCGERHAG